MLSALLLLGLSTPAQALPGTLPSGQQFAPQDNPNRTVITESQRGIKKLKGTRIWVKASSNPPEVDYCALLSKKGLVVECDYGWEIQDTENNVMLKCGSLPDETTAWLMKYLDFDEMVQWDWRNEPDYGMPYCDQMDAITIEIVTP